jgi:hypothetical protein
MAMDSITHIFEVFPYVRLGFCHRIPIFIGPILIVSIELVQRNPAIVGLLATFVDESLERVGVSDEQIAGDTHVPRFCEVSVVCTRFQP